MNNEKLAQIAKLSATAAAKGNRLEQKRLTLVGQYVLDVGKNIGIMPPAILSTDQSAPITESAAEASSALDSRQRAIVIGDPVPIVFGKRVQRTTYRWNADVALGIVYDVGGVFVSPGATEGRFSNDASTNELSVKFHLVLSEGDMPQLQLRDVFQRACRVGTWKQTYDRRAGTWTPGNFITAVAGKELWNCPIFCGTSGYYDNLTTLSYENTHADGDQTWDRQVHCFVREGIIVDRLIEGTAGSSNNVCDLAVYLIKQSSRFPDDLIDTATFTTAANFTETQQLYYNGEFKDSQNLEDWLQSISTYFLLRVSDNNGKKAFKPRMPITDAYAIDTGVVTPEFTFSEDHLLPDGFEIEWIPYADRRPTIMQMLWRQQPDDDIGLVRTSLVNIVDAFTGQPTEQHDMSAFCGSELHAVKVGAYLAARRVFVSHTLRIIVKPDAYNTTLTLGDIVRVKLQRQTDPEITTWHDYLYEVERINKTFSGAVELDLIHFPIDASGRSVVALYVKAAQIKGYEYATGRSTFNCDVEGRDEDETPLPDDGTTPGGLPPTDTDETPVDPDLPTWPPTVPEPDWPAGTDDPDDADNQAGRDSNVGGGGSGGVPGTTNPTDPFDGNAPGGNGSFSPSGDRPALPGDDWVFVPPCCPGKVWTYAVDCAAFDANLEYYTLAELDAKGFLIGEVSVADQDQDTGLCNPAEFRVLAEHTGYCLFSVYSCTDPGGPDGLGPILPGALSDKVAPSDTSSVYQSSTGAYRVLLPLTLNPIRDFYTDEPLSIYQKLTASCPTGGGEMWVKYGSTDQSIYGFTVCAGYAIDQVEVYELDPENPTVPGQQLNPIN